MGNPLSSQSDLLPTAMPIDYSLFRSDDPEPLEIRIARFLDANPPALSPQTVNSTRAVGDAIQQLMSDNFATLLRDEPVSYSANFARRAMADLAFTDESDNYYLVDSKPIASIPPSICQT